MGEDDYVTEARCKERCNNMSNKIASVEQISKEADNGLKEWLGKIDNRLWFLVFQGFATLLTVIGLIITIVSLINK